MADELTGHGLDFSFAPVLDLDHGGSTVIGNRAFHRDPVAAAQLAEALVAGMRGHQMASVGKHFPGTGRWPPQACSSDRAPAAQRPGPLSDARGFSGVNGQPHFPASHLGKNDAAPGVGRPGLTGAGRL